MAAQNENAEKNSNEPDKADEADEAELTEEQREALNDRLLTLRAQEYEGFVWTLEAKAKTQKVKRLQMIMISVHRYLCISEYWYVA